MFLFLSISSTHSVMGLLQISLFFFVCLSVGDSYIPLSRTKDDNIYKTVEKIRDVIKNGLPENDLPPLDPLDLKEIPIQINEDKMEADLILKNVLSNGLSNFQVFSTETDAEKLQLQLNIVLEELTTHTEFNGSMKMFEFIPLYGDGTIDIDLVTYRIDVDVVFKKAKDDKHLQVQEAKMYFSVKECNFNITGLLHSPDVSAIVSKFVSDMVPMFISEHKNWMTDTYSPFLEKFLNLVNLEYDDVFGKQLKN